MLLDGREEADDLTAIFLSVFTIKKTPRPQRTDGLWERNVTAEYVAVFFRSHSNWDAGKVLRESHKGKKSYREQGKKEAGVSSWADTTGLYAPAVMQEEPCLLILQDSRFQTCLAVPIVRILYLNPKYT